MSTTTIVDESLQKLLACRKAPPGTEVNYREHIIKIARAARDVFMSQSMLLEIAAPLNICGDTHGQYSDLLRLLEVGGLPPQSNASLWVIMLIGRSKVLK